jgi:hypothetical protein
MPVSGDQTLVAGLRPEGSEGAPAGPRLPEVLEPPMPVCYRRSRSMRRVVEGFCGEGPGFCYAGMIWNPGHQRGGACQGLTQAGSGSGGRGDSARIAGAADRSWARPSCLPRPPVAGGVHVWVLLAGGAHA